VWKVQPDVVNPQAAIDWFRQRLPITPDQFYALEERSRRQAFTVSGLGGLDVIQDVFNRLQGSLKNGSTFEEFKRDLPDQVRKAWGAGSAFRLQTIFDTNVQSAYQAGRWHAADEVRDSRPYWSLETVLDSRSSIICQKLRGTTLPADDPFWKTRGIPPFHFRCRTTLITFTREQAQARGISSKAPDVVVPDGFGHPPNAREWQPDPSKYDPALWAAHRTNTNLEQARQLIAESGHTPEIGFKPFDGDHPVSGESMRLDPAMYLSGKVHLNPRGPFWSDPERFFTNWNAGSEPYLSTSDPTRAVEHVIQHEIGHAEHDANDRERYLLGARTNLAGRSLELAKSVSAYAKTNRREFVAEVYAALKLGRTFPDAVLELYKNFGGKLP
jgi:SPP1 gp7 family putative phage head morphogenesis protein